MAKDPYKYFRIESSELVAKLTQGILQLEKGVAAPEAIPTLLRLAHTLKGAARVVKQPEIAESAHAIEELLGNLRDGRGSLSAEHGSELLQLLDQIGARVRALDSGARAEPAQSRSVRIEERIETLRVEMPEMDELLRGIGELSVQLAALQKGIAGAEHIRELSTLLVRQLSSRRNAVTENGPSDVSTIAGVRSLAQEISAGIDRLQRGLAVDVARANSELAEIHEVGHRLRLTPANTVFPSLDRVARDAAQALGKRVEFETTGGDVRLDVAVLTSMRDALAHVVRNAVAHGIETPEERAAAGKPESGRVRVDVTRHGARVVFTCSDDGRGIDIAAVRKAAVARGRVTAADANRLSSENVIALLQAGGLTTSAEITELSGRGIGLDVARETADQLKGELAIRSAANQGTTVELRVPILIASMEGLIVETAGTFAAIPLESVTRTLRLVDADIARSSSGDSIQHEGRFIPFLPLERALRIARPSGRRRTTWSAVVVQSGERVIAIGVDRLHKTAHVVMRSLPALLEADAVVSGASLDADGNPQLVLDPRGLVSAADGHPGVRLDEPIVPRAPILVVDDSLTTRMLEQSILQSAGYDVTLAVSAEDGLEKARERRYSLFIVDVEMPGMDGFEFVTLTRADPALRDTPAILLSSRNGAEDLRRGQQAGASAYIGKGEFDQRLLLQTIRQLVG